MKPFLSVLCSLLLIGCSESSSEKAPPVSSNESKTVVTSIEANRSLPAASAPSTEAVTAIKTVAVASSDADTLFNQKCVTCHGAKGEKSALNKSKIIADFTEQQIKDALKGYQEGTYGKEMKAVMQGQTKGLNDAQINALANYISSL